MTIESPDRTVTRIRIPWRAWYADSEVELEFPPEWRIRQFEPAGGPEIDDDAVARALARPVDAPRLRDLAPAESGAASSPSTT